MNVAVAGKGGAGKTTISATLARLVARRGRTVVAVDADSNPNLAVALGLRPGDDTVAPLPPSIVSRRLDGPRLAAPLDAVLDEHAVAAPDGVRLVAMGAPGHADEGCLCAAHATVSALLADLAGSEALCVIDMEASPEHLSRGTARHADLMLLVAEPYYRSLETVRRMAVLAAELPVPRVAVVANKVRSAGDGEAIAAFCERHGLELEAELPWSEGAMDADRRREALIDVHPAGDLVRAVDRLGERLTRH